MSKKRLGRIGLFLLVFIVPGTFLYLFSKGEQKFTPLPYFGPKEAIYVDGKPTGDTNYYQIEDFDMRMADGSIKSLDNFKNKFIIAMVVGQSCPIDCEFQSDAFIKLINKEMKGDADYDDVVIMAEYVHYDQDTPPDFKRIDPFFTKQIDKKHWQFFQCETNEFFDYSLSPGKPNMYRTTMAGTRNGRPYYNFAVLIDKKGHVRGAYNILSNSVNIRRMMDGLKILKKEEAYAKS